MKWRSCISATVICGMALSLTGCLSSQYGKKDVAEEVEPQNITDFETLFSQNCTGCHGVDGMKGASERLNYPLYLAIIPKKEIWKMITYSRPGSLMPPFAESQGGKLTQKQVDILVEGIEKNWAKPVDFHGHTPPPYYQPTDAKIDLANGKKIFLTVCAVCHGARGIVGPLATPAYLSLSSDQYIRTAILAGKPDQMPMMPNWQALKFGHPLSDDEITNVVGYLSSLRPPEARQAMTESKAQMPPSADLANHTGNSRTRAGKAQAQTNK